MADPKIPASKSSKTAAVVMLVVFLQVLVVAVLGLGAISRDRKEARRAAEDKAQAQTRDVLDSLVSSAQDKVRDTLREVRELVKRYADLELLQARGQRVYGDLVQMIYHVDPDTREVFWLDGEHRLWVPKGIRDRRVTDNGSTESQQIYDRLSRDVRNRNLTERSRHHKAIELIRRYPYRTDSDGYPDSVGLALELVPDVHRYALMQSDPQALTSAYVDLERALMAALEVVALNRDRQDELSEADRRLLDEIEGEVASVTSSLGADHPRIQRHVEAFAYAKKMLAGDMRDRVRFAVGEMGVEPKVVYVKPSLMAVIPLVRGEQASEARQGVALLGEKAMEFLVEDQAEQAGLEVLGLGFRLEPSGAPLTSDVVARRSLRDVPLLSIPRRAELIRIRPLSLPREGPGELFYWGIILLAAGGLGMGGYVLSRIYTREVRLARLKADFVSNLSHELKTPLTSIGLFTEMLQEGQLQTEEDKAEGLAVLAQESQRLQSIVARMLETARREARGVPYDLKPGDLNAIAIKAVDRQRRIVTDPGLRLETDLAPEPLPMLLDPAAMDDVITNLITNAWKYRQGDEVHIQVRTRRVGRKAELVVNDDGIGIPKADRRKVFEMFFRSDALLTKVSGTGLGLSLTRTIVRAHKGRIRVEPGEGGKGSLFRATFPLRKGAPRVSKPSPPPVASTESASEDEATS